jgi:hypothetical protein
VAPCGVCASQLPGENVALSSVRRHSPIEIKARPSVGAALAWTTTHSVPLLTFRLRTMQYLNKAMLWCAYGIHGREGATGVLRRGQAHTHAGSKLLNPASTKCLSVVSASASRSCRIKTKLVQSVKE